MVTPCLQLVVVVVLEETIRSVRESVCTVGVFWLQQKLLMTYVQGLS